MFNNTEFLSASDSETREIRPDLSRNPTRPSLAANPSTYTFQDERHHKKLSCGSSARVLDRALPSHQRSPGEAQPTIGGTCKFSSWSLVFVRSVPVDVVSPSHPHNCGIYFQSTFELYTRSLICLERDWKLISCSSPSFTTEDLCHQCDIYYYY